MTDPVMTFELRLDDPDRLEDQRRHVQRRLDLPLEVWEALLDKMRASAAAGRRGCVLDAGPWSCSARLLDEASDGSAWQIAIRTDEAPAWIDEEAATIEQARGDAERALEHARAARRELQRAHDRLVEMYDVPYVEGLGERTVPAALGQVDVALAAVEAALARD